MTIFLNILTMLHPTFAFIFLALIGINLVLLGWTFGFSRGLLKASVPEAREVWEPHWNETEVRELLEDYRKLAGTR